MPRLAMMAGLMLGIVLEAQQKTNLVVHRVEVQKLHTFAEGNKPPVQVLEDGATRPFSVEAWRKQIEGLESIGSLQNSYIITY